MSKYFESAIENIKELVKIKSVKGKPSKNMPFGEGVHNALNYILNLASQLGFEVVNYDNYIGEVIFGQGKDEEAFAVLCHLDVVPEGDESKWVYPPYSAMEVDGVIYGRGVIDNKAPAVLCLYALKELKDLNFMPSKKIKLIFGCDEESGWGCIEHYKKVAVMPKSGFSPDGDFPVIYAEKGILHVEFSFNLPKRIIKLSGGSAINVVCDYVTCELNEVSTCEKEILLQNGIVVENNLLIAYGKTAHGSTPELGENAIKKLFNALVQIKVLEKSVYDNLFNNQELFKSVKDETGVVTFSPNVCFILDDKIKVQVDIRYPATYKLLEIESIIKSISEYKNLHHSLPIINDKNGKLVTTLLNIYNKEYNKNEKPIAIGGGTYARALENGVAFGPSIIGVDACHVPNEKMKISDMQKCYNVYKKAIEELTK